MSVAAYLDGEEVAQVATNSGWRDFCMWGAARSGSQLRQLCTAGWSEELGVLERELRVALSSGDPTSDQRSVGEGLLAMLAGRGERVVLVVSDGFGTASE